MTEYLYVIKIEAPDLATANLLMGCLAEDGSSYPDLRGHEPIDVAGAHETMIAARLAADGYSNDNEIEALQEAVEFLAAIVGEPSYPEMCAECDEPIANDDVHATENLCGSCVHNARRSGGDV